MKVLHPVDEVVPPRAQQWLRRGEPCGWILRGHLALPLTAPLSGEVEHVNPSLLRYPTAADADDAGCWLLRIRPHEALADVPDLVRGEATLRHYLRRLEIIKRHVWEALATAGSLAVGTTLADGGTTDVSLERALGTARFLALVDELFPLPG